jgi:hypothetical protein
MLEWLVFRETWSPKYGSDRLNLGTVLANNKSEALTKAAMKFPGIQTDQLRVQSRVSADLGRFDPSSRIPALGLEGKKKLSEIREQEKRKRREYHERMTEKGGAKALKHARGGRLRSLQLKPEPE